MKSDADRSNSNNDSGDLLSDSSTDVQGSVKRNSVVKLVTKSDEQGPDKKNPIVEQKSETGDMLTSSMDIALTAALKTVKEEDIEEFLIHVQGVDRQSAKEQAKV